MVKYTKSNGICTLKMQWSESTKFLTFRLFSLDICNNLSFTIDIKSIFKYSMNASSNIYAQ